MKKFFNSLLYPIIVCGLVYACLLVDLNYKHDETSAPNKAVQVTVETTATPTRKPDPTIKPVSLKMQATPQSSCFSYVGYDGEKEILHAVFRTSGIEYIYYDFTQDDWDDFINADSLGTYFNKHIKGYYDYKKVGQYSTK